MNQRLIKLALLALLTLLSACSEPPPASWDQHVYIWQRQWRSEHAAALAATAKDFSQLRVLALQLHPQTGWSAARVDLTLLAQDARPVVAVLRIDGQLDTLDSAQILSRMNHLVNHWQSAGVTLTGIEIDYDCATSRLTPYSQLLKALRTQLSQNLSLSITALPDWLNSPVLEEVLTQVNSSVLQVHAVLDPQHGLFDRQRAERWTQRYAARSNAPFYLALPAYSVAITERGAIESEVSLMHGGANQVLSADARSVAALLGRLRKQAPPNLKGLIWFRLPLADDRRAWPLVTLQAVLHEQPLSAQLHVSQRTHNGLTQFYLHNSGNLAADLPARITLRTQQCSSADAAGYYQLQRDESELLLTLSKPARLEADQSQPLGWARCASINLGSSDELR